MISYKTNILNNVINISFGNTNTMITQAVTKTNGISGRLLY